MLEADDIYIRTVRTDKKQKKLKKKKLCFSLFSKKEKLQPVKIDKRGDYRMRIAIL